MPFFKNKKSIILLCFILLLTFLAAITGCSTTTPAPKPMPDGKTHPGAQSPNPNANLKSGNIMVPRMVIGYYENPWPNTPDTVGSLPSMKSFGKSLSSIAPYWYKCTKEGVIDAKDSKLAYDTARGMNLKIYPLITNMRDATDSILGDPAVRSTTINNIVKLVQEKNYDGVNIDFELLPPSHRDNLTAFMAELYPKMTAMNKTLIISVFPQVDVSEDVSGAYDYPNLAKNADFLQIMTYDKHWSGSEPGPVAPIAWYEDNIRYAIEKCGGANKVIVGVGAYGYNWVNKEGQTITYVDAITLAEKNGVGIMYDDKNQAPHFKYGENEVWFENVQSTEAKLNIIQKYKPAGIAIWRLGQEQPEIWGVIDSKFPKGNINTGNASQGKLWNKTTPTPTTPPGVPTVPPAAPAPNPAIPGPAAPTPAAPAPSSR